jgi:hypothetical protein
MSYTVWTIGKVLIGLVLLIGYIWFKEWGDWSLLSRVKNRSTIWTVIEGGVLLLLVLFIIFGLRQFLIKPGPH